MQLVIEDVCLLQLGYHTKELYTPQPIINGPSPVIRGCCLSLCFMIPIPTKCSLSRVQSMGELMMSTTSTAEIKEKGNNENH